MLHFNRISYLRPRIDAPRRLTPRIVALLSRHRSFLLVASSIRQRLVVVQSAPHVALLHRLVVRQASRLLALRPLAGAPPRTLGLAASVDGVGHGETGVLAQRIVHALRRIVQLHHAMGFALLCGRGNNADI